MENLTRNLKETGFSIRDMANRETFSKFVFNLHSHINTMLGKKNVLTYEEVRERYENFRSRCSKTKKNVKKFKMKGVLKGKLSESDKYELIDYLIGIAISDGDFSAKEGSVIMIIAITLELDQKKTFERLSNYDIDFEGMQKELANALNKLR